MWSISVRNFVHSDSCTTHIGQTLFVGFTEACQKDVIEI